jgi:hypothetical protein
MASRNNQSGGTEHKLVIFRDIFLKIRCQLRKVRKSPTVPNYLHVISIRSFNFSYGAYYVEESLVHLIKPYLLGTSFLCSRYLVVFNLGTVTHFHDYIVFGLNYIHARNQLPQ